VLSVEDAQFCITCLAVQGLVEGFVMWGPQKESCGLESLKGKEKLQRQGRECCTCIHNWFSYCRDQEWLCDQLSLTLWFPVCPSIHSYLAFNLQIQMIALNSNPLVSRTFFSRLVSCICFPFVSSEIRCRGIQFCSSVSNPRWCTLVTSLKKRNAHDWDYKGFFASPVAHVKRW